MNQDPSLPTTEEMRLLKAFSQKKERMFKSIATEPHSIFITPYGSRMILRWIRSLMFPGDYFKSWKPYHFTFQFRDWEIQICNYKNERSISWRLKSEQIWRVYRPRGRQLFESTFIAQNLEGIVSAFRTTVLEKFIALRKESDQRSESIWQIWTTRIAMESILSGTFQSNTPDPSDKKIRTVAHNAVKVINRWWSHLVEEYPLAFLHEATVQSRGFILHRDKIEYSDQDLKRRIRFPLDIDLSVEMLPFIEIFPNYEKTLEKSVRTAHLKRLIHMISDERIRLEQAASPGTLQTWSDELQETVRPILDFKTYPKELLHE